MKKIVILDVTVGIMKPFVWDKCCAMTISFPASLAI